MTPAEHNEQLAHEHLCQMDTEELIAIGLVFAEPMELQTGQQRWVSRMARRELALRYDGRPR